MYVSDERIQTRTLHTTMAREGSVQRAVFTDFDHFADSITGLNGRYIPTAPSQCDWEIDREGIGQLMLQRVQIGAPCTFAGDGESQGLTIGIPTSDARGIRIDGQQMAASGFIVLRNGRPMTYSSAQFTVWAGVSVPWQLRSDPVFEEAARQSTERLDRTRAFGKPAAVIALRSLIELLCGGSSNGFVQITGAQARAAAQEHLMLAVAQLIRDSDCHDGDQRLGRRPMKRDRIIARCLEYFRANEGQPILVTDLCREVNVSERTLRNVFYEYFGVGPVRFLKARQLCEIRSELLNACPEVSTITSIAARFGVWDFSLFARSYRALFGETPSQTLRTHRAHVPSMQIRGDFKLLQSWMDYASRRFERESFSIDHLRVDRD
jgi:AraC family ethanolamine operon transcriptional activator